MVNFDAIVIGSKNAGLTSAQALQRKAVFFKTVIAYKVNIKKALDFIRNLGLFQNILIKNN